MNACRGRASASTSVLQSIGTLNARRRNTSLRRLVWIFTLPSLSPVTLFVHLVVKCLRLALCHVPYRPRLSTAHMDSVELSWVAFAPTYSTYLPLPWLTARVRTRRSSRGTGAAGVQGRTRRDVLASLATGKEFDSA